VSSKRARCMSENSQPWSSATASGQRRDGAELLDGDQFSYRLACAALGLLVSKQRKSSYIVVRLISVGAYPRLRPTLSVCLKMPTTLSGARARRKSKDRS